MNKRDLLLATRLGPEFKARIGTPDGIAGDCGAATVSHRMLAAQAALGQLLV